MAHRFLFKFVPYACVLSLSANRQFWFCLKQIATTTTKTQKTSELNFCVLSCIRAMAAIATSNFDRKTTNQNYCLILSPLLVFIIQFVGFLSADIDARIYAPLAKWIFYEQSCSLNKEIFRVFRRDGIFRMQRHFGENWISSSLKLNWKGIFVEFFILLGFPFIFQTKHNNNNNNETRHPLAVWALIAYERMLMRDDRLCLWVFSRFRDQHQFNGAFRKWFVWHNSQGGGSVCCPSITWRLSFTH